MKRLLIAAVVLLAAAPAYAATGDLAWKAFDPESLPLLQRSSPKFAPEVTPAPADCGTVNPSAKVAVFKLGEESLRIAIDSAKADDKTLNLVRFDVAGTGKFAGQPTAPLKAEPSTGAPASFVMASFGPINLEWRLGGTTVPATVSGMWVTITRAPASDIADMDTGPAVGLPTNLAAMHVGTCLEGRCAFGDKVLAVRFIDANSNLKMTDTPSVIDLRKENQAAANDGGPVLRVAAGDLMQVAAEDGKSFKTYNVGQGVLIGGTWYEATVSADGSTVAAKPAKVVAGKLRIDAGQWCAQLVGGERVLAIEGGKDAVDVPAGKYVITQMSVQGGDETAVSVDPSFSSGKGISIEVTAGKTVSPAIGPPITAKVVATLKGREVTLNGTITDAGGRQTVLAVKTDRAPAEFEIVDAAGKRVDFATVEYT